MGQGPDAGVGGHPRGNGGGSPPGGKPVPPGVLLVLSAPSGAGKGTLRQALARRRPDLLYGVSVTSRAPRPGEKEGRHYYFTDRENFQEMIASGQLVEWAEVYGNLYGTPREPMETWLRQGRDVIIEKDVQGARTLMERYPDAIYVFILPPSLQELRHRIEGRGTEAPEVVQQRLRSATDELSRVDNYDYVIVNDDVAAATDKLWAILTAERARVKRYLAADCRFWLENMEPAAPRAGGSRGKGD